MYFNNMDSTENYPVYNRGDIVWVKLGSCWWPGEVKVRDDLPSDVSLNFKKPPLVIVKFFDEDNYEFVKSWSHILQYNCDRKKDFIKKGMVGYRSKLAHMAKFPKDIGTAEEKTNGNANILSLPEFLPAKKVNMSEIFGLSVPKKSPKIVKKTPTHTATKSLITHRRFLGNDDYRAYVCVQYPGKYRLFDSDDEEIQKLNEEPTKVIQCSKCPFATTRIEVMICHNKTHQQNPSLVTKRKLTKPQEWELSDSLDATNEIKSPKAKYRRKRQTKASSSFSNFLDGEWNLSEENESENTTGASSKKSAKGTKTYSRKKNLKSNQKDADNNYKSSSRKSKQKTTNSGLNTSQDSSDSLIKKNTQDDIKNCFDFDEEDEDEIIIPTSSSGRKIPRVIPQKPKTSIAELLKENSDIDEELPDIEKPQSGTSSIEVQRMVTQIENEGIGTDFNKDEILKTSETFNRTSSEVDEEIEQAFKDVMEETALPKLIDCRQNLKSEQNFHDGKTIKFPDKGGTESLRGGGGSSRSSGGTNLDIDTPLKETTVSKRSFDEFEAGFHRIKSEERKKRSDSNSKRINKVSENTAVSQTSEDIEQTPEDSKIPSDLSLLTETISNASERRKRDGRRRRKNDDENTVQLKQHTSEISKSKRKTLEASKEKEADNAEINENIIKSETNKQIPNSESIQETQGTKSKPYSDRKTSRRRRKTRWAESSKQDDPKETLDTNSTAGDIVSNKLEEISAIEKTQESSSSQSTDNVQNVENDDKFRVSDEESNSLSTPTTDFAADNKGVEVDDQLTDKESRPNRSKKRQIDSDDKHLEHSRKKGRLEKSKEETSKLIESSNENEEQIHNVNHNTRSKRLGTSWRHVDLSIGKKSSKKVDNGEVKKIDDEKFESKEIKSDAEKVEQNDPFETGEAVHRESTVNLDIGQSGDSATEEKSNDLEQQTTANQSAVKEVTGRRGKGRKNKSDDAHTSTKDHPEQSEREKSPTAKDVLEQEAKAANSNKVSRSTRSRGRKTDKKLDGAIPNVEIEVKPPVSTDGPTGYKKSDDLKENVNSDRHFLETQQFNVQDAVGQSAPGLEEKYGTDISELVSISPPKLEDEKMNQPQETVTEENVDTLTKPKRQTRNVEKPNTELADEIAKAKDARRDDESVETLVESSYKSKKSRLKKHIKDEEAAVQQKEVADSNIASPTRCSELGSSKNKSKDGEDAQCVVKTEEINLPTDGDSSGNKQEDDVKNQENITNVPVAEDDLTLSKHNPVIRETPSKTKRGRPRKVSEKNLEGRLTSENLSTASKNVEQNEKENVVVQPIEELHEGEQGNEDKITESLDELSSDLQPVSDLTTENKISAFEDEQIKQLEIEDGGCEFEKAAKSDDCVETEKKSLDETAEQVQNADQALRFPRGKTTEIGRNTNEMKEPIVDFPTEMGDVNIEIVGAEVNVNKVEYEEGTSETSELKQIVETPLNIPATPKLKKGRPRKSSKIEVEKIAEDSPVEETSSVEKERKVATSEEDKISIKTATSANRMLENINELQKEADVSAENEQSSELIDSIDQQHSVESVIQNANPQKQEISSVPLKKSRLSNEEIADKQQKAKEVETENQNQPDENQQQTIINVQQVQDAAVQENTLLQVPDKIEEVELILPLKKSKRMNEMNSNISEDSSIVSNQYTSDIISSGNNIEIVFDDSKITTSVPGENDCEKSNESIKVATIESNKETTDIFKCVPPKKKKLDTMKQDTFNNFLNNEANTLKSDVLQPPKKKMQKLFENSQVLERMEKSTNEMPLMSPLAKKKNFLFQEEDYEQIHSNLVVAPAAACISTTTAQPSAQPVETKQIKYHTGLAVSDDLLRPSTETPNVKELKMNVDEFFNLPEKDKVISCQPVAAAKIEPVLLETHQNEILEKANEIILQIEEQRGSSEVLKQPDPISNVKYKLNIVRRNGRFEVQKKDLSHSSTATIEKKESNDGSNQIEKIIEKDANVDSAITESTIPAGICLPSEPEFVPIEGTLTVMSEKDLADVQVEITPDKVINEKKPPMTLGSFSLDFSEPTCTKYMLSPSRRRKENTVSKTTIATATSSSTTVSDTVSTSVDVETTAAAISSIEMALKANEIETKIPIPQPNLYTSNSELLDILEGNSNSSSSNSNSSEMRIKNTATTSIQNDKKNAAYAMFDFEEAIPPQIVLSNKGQSTSSTPTESSSSSSPKLLERLSVAEESNKQPKTVPPQKPLLRNEKVITEINRPKPIINKMTKNFHPKIIIKPKATATVAAAAAAVAAASSASIGSNQISKTPTTGKPIILSEQIIRPANTVQKGIIPSSTQSAKQFEDVEDIEAFIIPKGVKTVAEKTAAITAAVRSDPKQKVRTIQKPVGGKAKILQQTIITPKGDIIHPKTTTSIVQTTTELPTDDSVFDINSMPIVLSDDLLTPESIQEMPVVLSNEVLNQNTVSRHHDIPVANTTTTTTTVLNKLVSNMPKQQIVLKTSVRPPVKVKQRLITNPIVNKLTKPIGNVIDARPTATTSRLIVTQSATGSPQGKIIKTPIRKQIITTTKPTSVTLDAANQMAGNKVMIVTNQYGQQQRVILTPEQQRMIMQTTSLGGRTLTKTIIKGPISRNVVSGQQVVAGPSGTLTKTIIQSAGVPNASHGSGGGNLLTTAIAKSGVKTISGPPKRFIQKVGGKTSKTIVIKNHFGQTVKKIQATDNEDLDRQVAEQLEAIKASTRLQQASKMSESTAVAAASGSGRSALSTVSKTVPVTTTVRRSYAKKNDINKPSAIPTLTSTVQTKVQHHSHIGTVGASSTIQQHVTASTTDLILKQRQQQQHHLQQQQQHQQQQQMSIKNQSETKTISLHGATEVKQARPPHQVILQDASGNQTTLTEGQIVAMPVDGQSSYMLVTLDEFGNLIPLSNEALMSLDPSLGIGGDVNNIVLQIDQGQGIISAVKPAVEPAAEAPVKKIEQQTVKTSTVKSQQIQHVTHQESQLVKPAATVEPLKTQQDLILPMAMNEGLVATDSAAVDSNLLYPGEQLTAQKILEAFPGGAAELEKLLVEGATLLINGQPVIFKSDGGDDQALISLTENIEATENSLFTSHKPNQDILAAALADTDVFQASDTATAHHQQSPAKTIQPTAQLSPRSSGGGGGGSVGGSASSMYPLNVGRVLETSSSLASPIMTPLEVPSTNSKKIDDEAEILNQVTKNVDLPITITDPNISQTVAQQSQQQQQQPVGLIELALPLSESSSSGTGELNSPTTFINTLSTLEETDSSTSHKSFSANMPLLTDDSTTESDSTTGKTSDNGGFASSFISLPLLAETVVNSTEPDKIKEISSSSLPVLTEDSTDDHDQTSNSNSNKSPRSSSASPTKEDLLDSGLSRLGGQMCSSLSEPPPDMFDLDALTSTSKSEETSSDLSSIEPPVEAESESSLQSEGSEEIPIQPQIVARLNDLKQTSIEALDRARNEDDNDQI